MENFPKLPKQLMLRSVYYLFLVSSLRFYVSLVN